MTVLQAGGAETYYTHAKWARPRVLGRLKGLIVNAVAWNRLQITEGMRHPFMMLNLHKSSFSSLEGGVSLITYSQSKLL